MPQPTKVTPPSDDTLKKYGISGDEWLAILESQGGVCPICKKPITTSEVRTIKDGKTTVSYKTNANIDHRHAPKWKKMKPEERKKFIRGIVCQFDNRFYMAKAMTIEKARNIIKYLENYEAKKEPF